MRVLSQDLKGSSQWTRFQMKMLIFIRIWMMIMMMIQHRMTRIECPTSVIDHLK